MARDTAAFLRMMNEDNERIAAREAAEQKAQRGDPVRIALDKARREKWGTLRAIEHMRSRPIQARSAFGSVRLYPDN